ncbi:MAG: hypothetical protein LBV43_00275 [Prevotella sp.]|jgi:tRNA A-37 threonylcarbamoyl transferase component Bud32|nr:hypothetical protein [Prevotella sp.]
MMPKIKIVINEKYSFLEDYIKALPDNFLNGGTTIYSGRNTIKVFEENGLKLNVKFFKKPIFINQIVYANFRQSKAKRSYLYATELKKNGFETPDPVAYMELKKHGLLKYCIYISIHEDFDGMMRILQRGSVNDYKDLITRFAKYTAELHEKQILHLDYSSGNILYKKLNGQYVFYLVDLNRMKFNKKISMETAAFNFRRLWGSDQMIEYFVEEYARIRCFDKEKCLIMTFKCRKNFWDNYTKYHPDASPYLE